MATAATVQSGKQTAYRVRAQSVEACNCQHGCNCQFGGYPNEGKCEFIIGFDVQEGRFGDIDLRGVRAVVAAKYPNAIHEGHGHVVLFIDEKTPQDKADAFATILSGQVGGMPWEAIAGTIERFEGPVRIPIEMRIQSQRARVRVPGAVELEATPLLDAVSGEEKEVHVTYPKGGFFWNDGSVVTTSVMKVTHGDMRMEWPNKWSAIAEVRWTNQA